MNTPFVQTFGSFVRNGSYPLEANYIFSSELDLKAWEEDNRKYLHEGLLKVVTSEDKLTLYLCHNGVFRPVLDSDSLDYINSLVEDSELHGLLRDLLRDFLNFTKSKLDALQQELDQTLVGSGLNGDGSFDTLNMEDTNYLLGTASIVHSLKTLDSKIGTLIEKIVNNLIWKEL